MFIMSLFSFSESLICVDELIIEFLNGAEWLLRIHVADPSLAWDQGLLVVA